jgi:LTXXQ motif family protein
LTAGARVAPLARVAAFGPRNFAARRQFAADPTFRSFWGHGWHPYNHLGWIGPLFWPYAYGDFFYYALWPYDYADVDPFWAYGYGDIYEAIFSPYAYDEYVEGPGAPARMATLTQGMAQSCADEAAEVTGWPIDQIQGAVQPNQEQTALLDDLGNAVVEASHEIKMHCPTSVSFTPTGRLAEMHQRLQTLVTAVNTVSPPLTKFYDALNDEQKARFNDIAPATPNAPVAGRSPRGTEASPQAQCNASIMAWPSDQIDRVVRPSDAQRVKLEALQSATAQSADTIKAACPSEVPSTPPNRIAAIGKRLQAMLQAVETVQPVLTDFYNSLSDDQKARFNTMGKQIFAQSQQ